MSKKKRLGDSPPRTAAAPAPISPSPARCSCARRTRDGRPRHRRPLGHAIDRNNERAQQGQPVRVEGRHLAVVRLHRGIAHELRVAAAAAEPVGARDAVPAVLFVGDTERCDLHQSGDTAEGRARRGPQRSLPGPGFEGLSRSPCACPQSPRRQPPSIAAAPASGSTDSGRRSALTGGSARRNLPTGIALGGPLRPGAN